MYQLAIGRDFIARHFLVGGDWGAENTLHSHHYRAEIVVEGADLDEHGYLIDIVELDAVVDEVVERVGERSLNDLPAFEAINPSLENFARIFWGMVASRIPLPGRTLSVKLWENERNWAAWRAALVPREDPSR